MKIALLYFASGNGKIPRAAEKIKKILEKNFTLDSSGSEREIVPINGEKESRKLSLYRYLLLLGNSSSFLGSKIDPKISHYLGNNGSLLGKKGYVFTLKRGFFTLKTHKFLMSAMEHEGIFLKSSEIFGSLKEINRIENKLIIREKTEINL